MTAPREISRGLVSIRAMAPLRHAGGLRRVGTAPSGRPSDRTRYGRTHDPARPVRHRGGRGHGVVALRAAGPARPAVGGRQRRAAPPGRRGARARDDVHDHRRGLRERDRRGRPRRRDAALARGHRAARVRPRAAHAEARATGSRRRCRAWRASAALDGATASGPGSGSAPRSASSTRRAPGRCWPRSSRSARPRAARSRSRSATRSAPGSCCSSSASAAGALLVRGVPPLALQRALGVVMVAHRAGDRHQADLRFQTALAEHAPGLPRQPDRVARALRPVEERLAELRGEVALRRHRARERRLGADRPRRGARLHRRRPLVQQPAPLTLAGLRGTRRAGRLLDLHLHQLPAHAAPTSEAWDARYRKDGLTIVGVHTPEFDFEHDAGNVRDAIARSGSATRSSRTTTTRPGTPRATSTGRPST